MPLQISSRIWERVCAPVRDYKLAVVDCALAVETSLCKITRQNPRTLRAMMHVRPKFLIVVLIFSATVFLTNHYLLGLYRVSGNSMTPTLLHGDWCLVWKPGARNLRMGDIVFFRTTNEPPLHFVKRIVAVPGQTISIEGGQMFINGDPVDEPYTKPNKTWSLRRTQVPHDLYYVIGDHRSTDITGHVHGMVATKNIQGRVVAHWRMPLLPACRG